MTFVQYLDRFFIGPLCTLGPIHGCWSHSLGPTPYCDLTDVALADEDTNPILTDDANRTFQGNVAMQVAPRGCKLVTYASSATWWPKLESMQVVPPGG